MYEGSMAMNAAREASTTPPVPRVTLAALLGRRELGLRLLAGPDDVALHWVHTSEMADPYPYLLGGELLLTAGVQLTDPARYVERVVEAGAAALGFGVTPVYDTVPAELVEACVRHGLPLIEVPPRTPFTAVARALWRLMAEARLYELRRVTEAQQSLAAAAARPAPVPAVLGALASRLGGRAVLYGADGTEWAAAGRELPPEAARALADLAGVVGPRPGGPASASGEGGGRRLAAYALGGGDGLALGVATERRDPGDHTVAGVAVVLLSLLTAPSRAGDVSARDGALTRLLLGAPAAEAAAALSPGPWTVVHARGGDGTPFAAASLAAELGTELVDAGPTVRLLLAPGAAATARPGWTLGVSAPAEASALPAADAQAARALRRAEATRAPLVRHRANGLAGLVDPAEAAAHARVLLAPLSEPQAETLRTWLSLHGSWDRTAAALGVHRNTVRQRIARCAVLLDRDLDDADVRMELWFALR
ncbi:PucR family transcriptional regulator ligand-binding domain-containing protein [Streptomyces sp. NPDC088090]|uniref:PucR family transcriptional regulator ligand-binding domain-containing protein n=1 Tax=Streptomyces sp. NPDC088090 TaxID=3365822 RepID=UPI003850E499